MPRREFTRSVRLEIIKRATDANGVPRCEICHGVANGGEVHHDDQDAMQTDKSRKLTAKDGRFLCKPCHKEITKAQAPVLAKAKRREARHTGAKTARGTIAKPFSENDRRRAEPISKIAAGVPNIMRRFQ